jgi:O-antigen ligase
MIEVLKILVFVAALGTATLSRRWSLAIVAFFLPLPRLLPEASLSGLNAPNVLLLPLVMHAFHAGRPPGPSNRRDPLRLPALLLLGMVFVSLVRVQLSHHQPVAFLQRGELYNNALFFKGMVIPFVGYFCARRLVRDGDAVRLAVAGAMCGYFLQALSGAADFLRGSGLDERATGQFSSSGQLGHFLAAYSMIPAAALMQGIRGRPLVGAILALILSVMGLFGSLSRGALLAFGGGITSMALAKRSAWIVVIAAVVLTAPTWLPQDYIARFQEDLTKDPTGLSRVPGFVGAQEFDVVDREARIKFWHAGMKMIADKPILGVGLGRFPYVLPDYGYTGGKHRSAHNVTVGLAAECGVLAALAHLAILVLFGTYALRLALTGREKQLRTFGLGMLGAIVAFAISGVVMPEFYRASYSGSYFILAGIVVNLLRFEDATPGGAAPGASPSPPQKSATTGAR